MKSKRLTKQLVGILLISNAIFSFSSCQDEMSESISQNQSKEIEVVNMNSYITTRATTDNTNIPVLKFKDEATFNKTIQNLKTMDYKEKVAFFKRLNFEGAFSTLYKADMELDKIFDIEDDNEFLKSYANFQKKYEGLFVYNTENQYDLSPYYSFTDEDIELVGNVYGNVMIGNQLKTAKATKAVIPTGPMPTTSAFTPFKGTELKIKQGKYYSTVETGHANGKLSVNFQAYKKKKLWTRRHPSTFHLEVNTLGAWGTINITDQHKGITIIIGNDVTTFPSHLNISYRNFTSSCTGNVVGNKTLTGILNPSSKI